jgi:ADP-Ribosyltransferase in polyvalent proteins
MNDSPWLDEALAANGRPICENFKDWFGGSQVVDAKGLPLVCFHGSRSDVIAFKGKDGFNFFAETPQGAGVYGNGPGACIYPVFLSIQKLLDLSGVDLGDEVTRKQASKILKVPEHMLPNPQFGKKGHIWEYLDAGAHQVLSSVFDGIRSTEDGNDVFVAFRSSQVKSALGNSGLYLKGSPDMDDLAYARALAKASAALAAIPKTIHKGYRDERFALVG